MIKLLTVSFLLFVFENALAQLPDALPPLPELEASLQCYHNRLWTTTRSELLVSQKGSLLAYLPGISFVPYTRNDHPTLTPVLSLNTNQFFSFLHNKKMQKARLTALDRKARLQFNEELTNLRLLYDRILLETQALQNTESLIWQTEQRQFDIYQEAFRKREMKPVDFYEKEKNYQSARLAQENRKQALRLLILEIKKAARYHLPDQDIALPAAPDCILK